MSVRLRPIWALLAVAVMGGACKKKEAAPAATDKTHKQVVAKPLAKKDAKPGPAASGHNTPIEAGEGEEKAAQPDSGHLRLSYDGEDSPARRMVRASGIFEKIIPQLDQALRLPNDIAIKFAACDEVNAFYNPELATITMCDEYVDFYAELFSRFEGEDRDRAILGSLVSTFLHELGHALIHQLDLPAVGRQEDAVDQLASVILIASGDQGGELALEGALSFIAEAEAGEEDTTPFWDEHSLNEQRFYNAMCLIYGSDPDGWDGLVGDDDLPEERAEQCPEEYETISKSWTRLLQPYLTVPAMRMKLKAPDAAPE